MTMARSESCTAKPWAILLIVFLGGAASGVLVQKAITPKPTPPPEAATAQSPIDATVAVEHLESELSLSQDQIQEVRGILDDCIMREADLMTQIQFIKSEGRERISKVLSEPQRTKFQAMLLEASAH